MAIELNAGMAGSYLVFSVIAYVFAFAFQMYMVYLNWKQSKVRDTQKEILYEMREIKGHIRKCIGLKGMSK